MWRKTLVSCVNRCRWMSTRPSPNASAPSPNASAVVNTVIFRSLKDHYAEVAKMNPPPKVNPPSPFTVVKGSLDSNGAVLKRSYNDEEISISVMRMANILPAGDEEDDMNDDSIINQLFVHVDISKPGQTSSLHFFCGLYPEALGIHSVSLRPKADQSNLHELLNKYSGPTFEQLNDRVRDSMHSYIEERGIDQSLFPFLQAWLYVKDHRNLMKWYKAVGTILQKGKEEGSLQAQ